MVYRLRLICIIGFSALTLAFPEAQGSQECLQKAVFDVFQKRQESHGSVPHSSKLPLPQAVEVKDLSLLPLSKEHLGAVREGVPYQYVVDERGAVHLLKDSGELDPKSFWLGKSKSPSGEETGLVIQEYGDLRFLPEKGTYELSPAYNLDLSPEETDLIAESLRKAAPEWKFASRSDSGVLKSRLLECSEILGSRKSGKSFVIDKIIADSAVTVSAILTGELMGKGRMSTPEGRKLVAADLIASPLSTAISGSISRYLVIKDVGNVTAYGVRALTNYATIEGQRQAHQAIFQDSEGAEELADQIKRYNLAHMAVRIPVNHMVDKWFLNTLPKLLMSACLRGTNTKIFLSPRMIRIYERYASSLIYYGFRPQPEASSKSPQETP